MIASVDYALSVFIAFFVSFYATSWFGMPILDYKSVFIIYTLVLITHGLLNTFGVGLVKRLMDISVWWHVFGVLVIVVALIVIPDRGNTIGFGASFDYKNFTGWSFGGSGIYVFIIGMLIAQYTITGFDASAHVSEETKDAKVGAPKAIVRSIYISVIAAWILNFTLAAAIPKDAYKNLFGGGPKDLVGGGTSLIPAPLRIFEQSVAGNMSKTIIFIAIVGQFFCGMASVTANSRMIYAFSRDGALPGSKRWHRINPRTRTPTNSVWLGVTLAFLLGFLTFLQSGSYAVAFFAFVGITAVGLYIAYIIPVFLRLRSKTFVQGPWNLRGFSKLVGWTAVVYVVFINLMFLAPQFGPVSAFWPPWGGDVPGTTFPKVNNFNFTGPLIIAFAIFVWIYWEVSAKKWFKGPQVMGDEATLRRIEAELAAVERGEALAEEFYAMEDALEPVHGGDGQGGDGHGGAPVGGGGTGDVSGGVGGGGESDSSCQHRCRTMEGAASTGAAPPPSSLPRRGESVPRDRTGD